jgi:hypothetical protein
VGKSERCPSLPECEELSSQLALVCGETPEWWLCFTQHGHRLLIHCSSSPGLSLASWCVRNSVFICVALVVFHRGTGRPSVSGLLPYSWGCMGCRRVWSVPVQGATRIVEDLCSFLKQPWNLNSCSNSFQRGWESLLSLSHSYSRHGGFSYW